MTDYNIKYVIDIHDKVSPKLKRIQRELAKIDKALQAMKKPIRLTLNTKTIRDQLARLKRLAVIKAKIHADFKKFRADLAAITAKVITIRVVLDLTRAKQQLKAFENRMSRIRVRLDRQPTPPSGAPPIGQPQGRGRTGREGVGIIGAMAVGAGIADAMSMDHAMMLLEKATNASTSQLKSFKNMAVSLESETGRAAAEIIQMATDASKAGIATKNLERVLKDQIKVSVAWDMSMEDTSERLTHIRAGLYSSIKDFKAQQDAVMQTAGAIAYLSDKSEASEYYLANYLGRTAGLVSAFKQTQEAVMAAGGAFEAIGIAPEVAARAMNSAAASFAVMARKLKADSPILKTLGTNLEGFKDALSKDMVGTLFKIVKGTEKLSNLERINIMTEIFGVGFADELIRLGSAQDVYVRNLGLMNQKSAIASTLQEQYNIQMKYMTIQVQKMTNGVKTLLGTAIAPYLEGFSRTAADVIEQMKQYPMIIDFAAAVAFAALALGSAAIGSLFLSGAVLLMVAQVAAVIFVFKQAYDNSEALRTAFGNLGEMLDKIFKNLGMTTSATEAMNAAFTGIGIVLSLVVELITQAINGIATLIEVMWELAGGNFSGAWDAWIKGAQRAEESVKKLGESIKNDLQGTAIKIEAAKAQAGLTTGLPAAPVAAAKAETERQNMILRAESEAAKAQAQAAKANVESSRVIKDAAMSMMQAAEKMGSSSGGSVPFYALGLGGQGR